MTPEPLTVDDVVTTQRRGGVQWWFVRHPKRKTERQATMSYEAAVEQAKRWWPEVRG